MNVCENNKLSYDISEDKKTVKLLLDGNPIAKILIKTGDKSSYMVIKYASTSSNTEVKITLNDDMHRSIQEDNFKVGSFGVKQMISAYNSDHVIANVLYMYGAYTDCYYEVITAFVYDDKININIESTEDIGYGADIYRTNSSQEELNLYGIYGEINSSYRISDIKEVH